MDTKLSSRIVALIAAGASAVVIGNQFLDEKEGNRLDAYRDGSGVWTICRGVTAGVYPGMRLTESECNQRNAEEFDKADKELTRLAPKAQLSEPARAGIVSFCTYNLGAGKCGSSTFIKMLRGEGTTPATCKQIMRWIYDQGKDCRVDRSCRGQVLRREQEEELCNSK